MRARALISGLVAALLLSLVVVRCQHELVEELREDVDRLTTQHASRTSQLREAVGKNVELSERITRLSDESARHHAAALAAEKAAKELEAALEKRGHAAKALEERLKSVEEAIESLTAHLDKDRETLAVRVADELEPTRAALKELRKEISDLRTESARTVEEVAAQLAPLSAKVDELAASVREVESTEPQETRVLDELAQLTTLLAGQKRALESLSRKIEIVGKMLAADGRAFETGGEPPPPIEARVDVVDSSRGEVAVGGNLEGLRPGHLVWIGRDGLAVARAEVFRVDEANRLAAARITWSLAEDAPRVGDTVTTTRPGGDAKTPDGPAEQPGSEEGEAESSDGATSPAGSRAVLPAEGPISREGAPLREVLERNRPPPPPPRPEREG